MFNIASKTAFLGSLFSVFPFHTEDRLLQAMLYHFGGAVKCWVIVPPEHLPSLMALQKRVYAAIPVGERQQFGCPEVFLHKWPFMHPKLLEANGTVSSFISLNRCLLILMM